MLWQMAEEFVRAEVPVEVVQGIRLGRRPGTAKQKRGCRAEPLTGRVPGGL